MAIMRSGETAVPFEFKDRNLLLHGELEGNCSQGAVTRKNRSAVRARRGRRR